MADPAMSQILMQAILWSCLASVAGVFLWQRR